uniref:Uncharacterized protein n=1 Tax=Myoviridae sp. ctj9o3 TaxID=2826688 RepID=A0A8S5MBX5_9CAUD|nr:MAG TPA: hypothetical protein [Myoviridae sp. ctj9o3]
MLIFTLTLNIFSPFIFIFHLINTPCKFPYYF